MKTKSIVAADLFCGAGGTSAGLVKACRELGLGTPDILAVNHWDVAIKNHKINHPYARHICASIENLDPVHALGGGRHLDILLASPECVHFSRARGGRPCSEQSRSSGWHILRWIELLHVDNILLENVPDFLSWGPVMKTGRPLKSRKGETFRAFLAALRSLNFSVDYRVLSAASYGDPTSRERLFILARRGKKRIEWPEPTHSQVPDLRLFGWTESWRSAREIIDWDIPSKSIFGRKKPLAGSTINRIVAGLRKFGGAGAEPFLVILRNHADAQSLDRPIPTITSSGTHLGVCQPFLVPFFGEREGQTPRVHSIDDPIPTVTSHGAGALIEPFIIPVHHGKQDERCYSLQRPMPAITTIDGWALIEPEIREESEEPRGILVKGRTRDGNAIEFLLDIRFRMLTPKELARGMSMDDFVFEGTRKETVKMIGNAVPTELAKHLCISLLKDKAITLPRAA